MASQINIQDLDLYLTINDDSTSSLSTTQPTTINHYIIYLTHYNSNACTIEWDENNIANSLTVTGKNTGFEGLKNGTSLFGLSSDFIGKTNTIKYNVADYATSPKSSSDEGTGTAVSSNDIIIEQDDNVYINLMNAQHEMQENGCYSMQITFTRGETSANTCYIHIYGLDNGNSIDIVSGDENLYSQTTTIDSNCSLQYPIGQSLVLKAIPHSGYSFNEYNYVMSGNSYSSTSNTLTLTLAGETTVTVKFSETQQDDPIFDDEFVTITINGLDPDQIVRLRYTFNDNMLTADFTKENNFNSQIPKGSKCNFSAQNPSGVMVDWDSDSSTPASDQYSIDSIQDDTVLNVKFVDTVSTYTLTINGFVDNGWKVIATPSNSSGNNLTIYEFSSQNQSISIPAGTMLILDFEKVSNIDSYYSQGKLYLNNVEVYNVTMNSDKTLNCAFSELRIIIENTQLHFGIENLVGGELIDSNIINRILFGYTVEFDIVPNENYIFNNYSISSNGSTKTSNDTRVIIPNIKTTCSLTVALTKDNTSSNIILSDEFEEKHFRFKIKYKNVDNEIWIDWNPKIYKYKYIDENQSN